MMPYTVACELPPGQVFNPDTDRYSRPLTASAWGQQTTIYQERPLACACRMNMSRFRMSVVTTLHMLAEYKQLLQTHGTRTT